jgi:hypothetical protein
MGIEFIRNIMKKDGQTYYEAIAERNEKLRASEAIQLGSEYNFWNNEADDIYDIVEGHENSTDKVFIHNQQEYLKVAKKLLVTKKTVCRKKLLIKLKERREILTSTIQDMERWKITND